MRRYDKNLAVQFTFNIWRQYSQDILAVQVYLFPYKYTQQPGLSQNPNCLIIIFIITTVNYTYLSICNSNAIPDWHPWGTCSSLMIVSINVISTRVSTESHKRDQTFSLANTGPRDQAALDFEKCILFNQGFTPFNKIYQVNDTKFKQVLNYF